MYLLLLLIIAIFIILLYLILTRKSKKRKLNGFIQKSSSQTTNKCLWENPCGNNGTLIQDCKDSTGNIVPCDPSVVEAVYLKSGKCTCYPGYAGDQCQYSNSFTCNNNGTANNDGTCTCSPGYVGNACQYSRSITCNNRGNPNEDGTCSCDYSNPDPMCSDRQIGCGYSTCKLSQMLFIKGDNKTYVCNEEPQCEWKTTDPNPCSVNGIANSNMPNILTSGVNILCNVPIIITTCRLSKLTKPRVLYRDPVSNTVRFEVLEDIRNEPENYVWIFTCSLSYPTLSLYNDYSGKVNPLPSLNWAGMNNQIAFGTGNEAWMSYDYNNKVLCIGSSDNHCKGYLGYDPLKFSIGSNPDAGNIFQNEDVWYSIQTDRNGTLAEGF